MCVAINDSLRARSVIVHAYFIAGLGVPRHTHTHTHTRYTYSCSLGFSLTIVFSGASRLRPCVLQTDTSSSYLAVDSTHTAVGRFRSLVRRSGTRCLTSSEIRRVVLIVLNSFLRQSSFVFSFSALEVFSNDIRYIDPRFTYALTYLAHCRLPRYVGSPKVTL